MLGPRFHLPTISRMCTASAAIIRVAYSSGGSKSLTFQEVESSRIPRREKARIRDPSFANRSYPQSTGKRGDAACDEMTKPGSCYNKLSAGPAGQPSHPSTPPDAWPAVPSPDHLPNVYSFRRNHPSRIFLRRQQKFDISGSRIHRSIDETLNRASPSIRKGALSMDNEMQCSKIS